MLTDAQAKPPGFLPPADGSSSSTPLRPLGTTLPSSERNGQRADKSPGTGPSSAGVRLHALGLKMQQGDVPGIKAYAVSGMSSMMLAFA